MGNGARIAIVTGGSRGIGRSVAEALLGEGWLVRFCGRTPEHVETAQKELSAKFGDAVSGAAVDARHQEELSRRLAPFRTFPQHLSLRNSPPLGPPASPPACEPAFPRPLKAPS